jgi:hypothetical protein
LKSGSCETGQAIVMQAHAAPGVATFSELSLTANISLKEKYRLTRKALVKAGLDITTAGWTRSTATGADGVISWTRALWTAPL